MFFVRMLHQHRVEHVLDSAPDERFQVVLESGFVDFDDRDSLVGFAKENIRPPFKKKDLGC